MMVITAFEDCIISVIAGDDTARNKDQEPLTTAEELSPYGNQMALYEVSRVDFHWWILLRNEFRVFSP